MCFMNFSGLRNSFRFEKVEIISVISELKWTINPDNHLYDFSENLMQKKKISSYFWAHNAFQIH